MDGEYTFDASVEAARIVDWIKDTMDDTGGEVAVIGLSGGKDSTVVAALCSMALGKENTVGVVLPDGRMPDAHLAHTVGWMYCGRTLELDISGAVNAISKGDWTSDGETRRTFGGTRKAEINLPARIRMAALYWVAQSLDRSCRVMNTCNLSEDWVGYSTRYGDAAGDLSPLGGYTVTEVREIGRAIGVPSALVDKVPSDGLCGRTDEESLGFTYRVLDRYIRTGECDDPSVKEVIDSLHRRNLFKLEPMPVCRPEGINSTSVYHIM